MPPTPRRSSFLPLVTGILLVLLGLGLALPGFWLIGLGGSFYYAVAGVLMVASGILMIRLHPGASAVYAALLLYTLVWALGRVGLDGWRLLPPLALPAGMGLWVFSPWITGRLLQSTNRGFFSKPVVAGGMAFCAALFVFVFACGWHITASRDQQFNPFPGETGATLPGADQQAANDWQFYGGTPAGDRFAMPTQINASNAHDLKVAWVYHSKDLPRAGENSRGREFSFEATPIKIGNRLFFCTPHRDVVALDATSGKEIWRYSPGGEFGKNIYQACRGVSYVNAPGTDCAHRIVSTNSSSPPTLFEVDADTGKLCESFGDHGVVDLRSGMGAIPPGFHFITSPPMVLHNRIMTSGWVYDDQTVGEPSGVIRGFDAITGQLAWAWDMGRTPTNKPLDPGEVFTRGTANGWGVYTADAGLNMVYVPLGIATPDYFGGKRRSFDEKYDSSLVALDITTGEERWHFQTVHHDLWDFDLPVGPSLVDLPDAHGTLTPALVQTTKQGELFVLDRRTGAPFYRVQETSVPAGDTPGEHYSPTQPLSVDMPNLRRPNLTEDDMWGATPYDQMFCRIAFRSMRDKGLFTPPSQKGTVGFPAFDGVADWYGGTIDPTHGVMYINTTFIPFLMTLVPQEKALAKGLYKSWHDWAQPYPEPVFTNNPQHGLPFAAVVKPWLGPFGAPCLAPPWGKMQAIDLVHRRVIWERALGTTKNVGPTNMLRMPVGLPTSVFSMGGSVTTPNGLVFMGALADQSFHVLDGHDGHTLFKTELDAGGNATPLTYIGEDGRQYVVLAVGGHGGLKTRNSDEVVAFALPKAP